ncbi:iron complex transport system substrate-binding protein [Psychrobacillus insolitus]|uniref:Iron complex transport system substrate-binding protein n=1 Tax=Psychrobacillus insolitus TaxID=1461 RepID=A0A2W7M9E0_9BACI|nr:ABC transporter substrate-binding protein [Psychrobacillus insolitus]PZX01619.1 iron complex transport system substrate-binding protein [Psychrobacillus insolitus]
MKKRLIFIVAALMLVLAACGNEDSTKEETTKNDDTETSKITSDTITYQSESGPIEVPANPQRVVVLSLYAGDLIQLGVNIVGADSWLKDNPNFAEGLANAEVIASDDYEKIIELDPDLIIGSVDVEDAAKLQEIAPTVLFTYGAIGYLEQHIEVAKVVNKEAEATAWVEDFKVRSQAVGEEIKAKYGEDVTVTVAGNYDKQISLFGDNWGRGTEIIYQEMGLKMPQSVEDVVLDPGYFTISEEVFGDYIGDFLVLNVVREGQDTTFLDSNWYNNIPAVKNGNVFYAEGPAFYYNDSYSLDFQLDFFKKSFLGN